MISGAEVKKQRYKSSDEQNGLVWLDNRWKEISPFTRAIAAAYFRPNKLEMLGGGFIYRMLGIKFVAWTIPTGGMLWRRLFKWDGWTFALRAPNLSMAREYRYSTCVFEILHTSALLLMLPDGIDSFRYGYTDGILKFVLAGLLMNGWPIMLQRYNRVRIQLLYEKYQKRRRRREDRGEHE